MVLEILYVEPIYPQYSGVPKTCLALRYLFFDVLGSESVNILIEPAFWMPLIHMKDFLTQIWLLWCYVRYMN